MKIHPYEAPSFTDQSLPARLNSLNSGGGGQKASWADRSSFQDRVTLSENARLILSRSSAPVSSGFWRELFSDPDFNKEIARFVECEIAKSSSEMVASGFRIKNVVLPEVHEMPDGFSRIWAQQGTRIPHATGNRDASASLSVDMQQVDTRQLPSKPVAGIQAEGTIEFSGGKTLAFEAVFSVGGPPESSLVDIMADPDGEMMVRSAERAGSQPPVQPVVISFEIDGVSDMASHPAVVSGHGVFRFASDTAVAGAHVEKAVSPSRKTEMGWMAVSGPFSGDTEDSMGTISRITIRGAGDDEEKPRMSLAQGAVDAESADVASEPEDIDKPETKSRLSAEEDNPDPSERDRYPEEEEAYEPVPGWVRFIQRLIDRIGRVGRFLAGLFQSG